MSRKSAMEWIKAISATLGEAWDGYVKKIWAKKKQQVSTPVLPLKSPTNNSHPPSPAQEDRLPLLEKPVLSLADISEQCLAKERKILSKSLAENCNNKINTRFFVGFDSEGVYVWDREAQIDAKKVYCGVKPNLNLIVMKHVLLKYISNQYKN